MIIGGPDPLSGKYTHQLRKEDYIIASGANYSSGALQGLDTAPDWVLYFPAISQGQTITISNVIFGGGVGVPYGTDFYNVDIPTEAFAPEPQPRAVIVGGSALCLLSALVRRGRAVKPLRSFRY